MRGLPPAPSTRATTCATRHARRGDPRATFTGAPLTDASGAAARAIARTVACSLARAARVVGPRRVGASCAATVVSATLAAVAAFATLVAAPLAVPTLGAQPAARRADAARPAARATEAHAVSHAVTTVAARVSPSVVQVVATVAAPVTPWGSERTAWLPGASLLGAGGGGAGGGANLGANPTRGAARQNGSGFVIDASGLVATNAHVVRGAARVRVALSGGATPTVRWVDAEIVGMDVETDLALLRLLPAPGAPGALGAGDAPPLPPPLPIAAGRSLVAGQLVVVVGSPMGLKNSVSLGVVSAPARALAPDARMAYVQTDAPINPGSSGGPLLDLDGRVVGLSTFILSHAGGSEGLGFAVPADLVQRVLDELRAHGRVRRGHLGAEVQALTPSLAAGLGHLPQAGLLVADVDEGGPGAQAGLQIGDLLVALDGEPLQAPWQLARALVGRTAGSPARLTVRRGEPATRTTLELTVTLGARAPDADALARLAHAELHVVPQLGIVGLDVDEGGAVPVADGDRRARTERGERGVLVAAAAPLGGPEDSAFEPGDIVVWLVGRRIASLADMRAAVAPLDARAPIVAQVVRRGALRFVAFTRE